MFCRPLTVSMLLAAMRITWVWEYMLQPVIAQLTSMLTSAVLGHAAALGSVPVLFHVIATVLRDLLQRDEA